MSMIMIADNPVLGVGFAQFLPASLTKYRALVPLAQQFEPTSEHHQILTIAVEVGLIGVTLYLWMIVMFLILAYSLFTGLPRTGYFDPNLALLIGLALGVYILNSLFIDPSYQLFPNAVFFTFGGIADGLYGRLPQIQAAAEVAIPLGLSPSYGA
jgi:O-antigen ligase